MLSLVYVSMSTMRPLDAEAGVAAIVDAALRINSSMDVTGALIFTGVHFAQILEGPETAVDAIMASIHADIRHDGVIVADRSPVSTRIFPAWSLAYQGSVPFVARHITQVFNSETLIRRRHAASALTKLMHQFTIT